MAPTYAREAEGSSEALRDRVLEEMPDEESLYDLAELFKVFGDTTRIRILYALFEAEMCVCDIAQILNMTQSAISHQLRVLKQARLVRNRREGKQIYYSLADDHVRTIKDCTVSFMTLKMKVEFDEGVDADAVMKNVRANCKKVEDDCEIFL